MNHLRNIYKTAEHINYIQTNTEQFIKHVTQTRKHVEYSKWLRAIYTILLYFMHIFIITGTSVLSGGRCPTDCIVKNANSVGFSFESTHARSFLIERFEAS